VAEQSRTVKFPAVPVGDVLSDDGTFIVPGGGSGPVARGINAELKTESASVLSVGTDVIAVLAYDMTIDPAQQWVIRTKGGSTASVVVDVQRATVAAPGTFASIAASAKPTLTADNYNTGAMTGWSTSLLKGETIRLVVESASGTNRVIVSFPTSTS
jgi:hypothetical protein